MAEVVVAWMVLALGLLAFELHHLAFYAIFAGIGAAAAAVVAAFAPSAILVQAVVAVGVAFGSTLAVRPALQSAFDRRRHGGTVARGVHGGLVGHEAVTLDRIGDAAQPGHVRLAGERWLAATVEGHSIEAGCQVMVTAVRGTTLTVIASLEIESNEGETP